MSVTGVTSVTSVTSVTNITKKCGECEFHLEKQKLAQSAHIFVQDKAMSLLDPQVFQELRQSAVQNLMDRETALCEHQHIHLQRAACRRLVCDIHK